MIARNTALPARPRPCSDAAVSLRLVCVASLGLVPACRDPNPYFQEPPFASTGAGDESQTSAVAPTTTPGLTATDTASTEAVDPTTDPSTTAITATASAPTSLDTDTGPVTDPATSDTGNVTCQEAMFNLPVVTPNVMFTLDKSGSMAVNPGGYWDHDGDPNTAKITRWDSVFQAVQKIVGGFEATIHFGANLFPSEMAMAAYDATACPVSAVVEVPAAPMNGQALLAQIPKANDVTLKGGTPTAAGLSVALAHLESLDPSDPRAVVLITDGAANCNSDAMSEVERFEVYDASVHAIVGDAYAMDGIPTYVVGIAIKDELSGEEMDGNPDATNTFQRLNELAVQGGRPNSDPDAKFYDAQNQFELQTALDAIFNNLACVVKLSAPPDMPELVEVLVDGEAFPQVMDCKLEDGWVYTGPDHDAIKLCGAACGGLMVVGEVDVNYYCD